MTDVIKGNDRLVVNQINYFFLLSINNPAHIAMFQPNVLFEGLNHIGCGTLFFRTLKMPYFIGKLLDITM